MTDGRHLDQHVENRKIAMKNASPSFVALAFRNGLEYRNSISKSSMCMIWLHRVKIW